MVGAFIGLMASLIKPSLFSRLSPSFSRKNGLATFGIATIVLGSVAGAIMPTESTSVNEVSQFISEPTTVPTTASVDSSEVLSTSSQTVTETEDIAFKTIEATDSSILSGSAERTSGTLGKKEVYYLVSYEDGQEVGREKTGESIIIQPINSVITRGTKRTTTTPPITDSIQQPITQPVKPESLPQILQPIDNNCHPSYSPCIIDNGQDVDCQGGSGNGPRYVKGPITVSSDSDPYGLDRDGDGIGCESN